MKKIFWMAGMILSVSIASAQEKPLRPMDFAKGILLTPETAASLYEVVLTPEIYRGVTRNDLGDLRVFNKEGTVVPYTIVWQPKEETIETQWMALSPFPLYEGVKQTPDGLSLIIHHQKTDATVDVTAREQAKGKKIVGYLLDTSALQDPVQSLSFRFEPQGSFIRKMRVQTSDNLKNWMTVEDDGVLAHLVQGGQTLTRNVLEFSSTKAAYFRLSYTDTSDEDPNLIGVDAQMDPGKKEPERQWITVIGKKEEGADIVFDTGGYFPVDRIEALLPESNMLIAARLDAAANPTSYRQFQYEGTLYRLTQNGQEVSTGPQPVNSPRSSFRFWFLHPQNKEGLTSSKPISLRLGWVPERLVFVAQGEGPYTLAYGSAVVPSANFGMDSLLQQQKDPNFKAETISGTIRWGKETSLGGDEKLLPPKPSPMQRWKKALTLSLMVLATLILGLIAYRLMRQMGSQGGSSPDSPPDKEAARRG